MKKKHLNYIKRNFNHTTNEQGNTKLKRDNNLWQKKDNKFKKQTQQQINMNSMRIFKNKKKNKVMMNI